MTIGEKIKELRKKNDLTQEKLADYLCVSYQAVSKWECGLSSPDLSLIGPLTKLLHVSADELLGLKNDSIDSRREELENAERETWKSGDLAKRYEIACTAVAEYPGEMKYLDWLAWCEAMRSFDFKDDSEYIAEQEKAIKHFAAVIENTTDEKIKTSSVQGIVQYLCFRGRHDEAKKYAELYPENLSVSKDRVLLDCLQGNEKIKYYQKMLANMLSEILNHIGCDNLEACEAQEKILNAIITDGNYLYYNYYLTHNYRKRAAIYTSNGEYEKAVLHLQKALEYATAADAADKENTVYRFTTPFLNQLEYNPDDFWRTGGTKYVEDFYEYIKCNPLDKLHNREDFQKYFNI
ncbi:MAG: helix-turn-helix transcriptional regulator [Clostridia bacterium]|nr:helix-turn-helix transcriptional regulator [Clostridia bacterium]